MKVSSEKIILHPKYVEDFQCDGSKCNSKCCRNNWRIDIDVNTYKKYQRIKNPVMRKKILSSIQPSTSQTGFEIKFNKDGVCPLLCDDNLCYIHRYLGEEALSITGRVYPRMVRHIGRYQFRMLSMTCPVAAKQALFSYDGMEIRQMNCEADTGAWQLTEKVCERKNVPDDLVAVHIIMGGLSILQNRLYSFEQRLVLLGLFLDRVEDCPQDVETVVELIDYYNSQEFQCEISSLWNNWKFYSTANKQLMAGIFEMLKKEKRLISSEPWLIMNANSDKVYGERYQLLQEKFGNVLECYWQHEWLYHVYPYFLQGGLLHNYFSYVIAYDIYQLWICSAYDLDNGWNENNMINALGIVSKVLDHGHNFSEVLVKETEIFESEPLKLMQVLLRLE